LFWEREREEGKQGRRSENLLSSAPLKDGW
jgi:hypothetical protein